MSDSVWRYVCIGCGHQVTAGVDFHATCPECHGSRWLCRWLDPPAMPELSSETITSLRGDRTCNKIEGRVKGRPHANVPAREVMRLSSEGVSLRAIADRVGVSHMTVKRILAREGVL